MLLYRKNSLQPSQDRTPNQRHATDHPRYSTVSLMDVLARQGSEAARGRGVTHGLKGARGRTPFLAKPSFGPSFFEETSPAAERMIKRQGATNTTQRNESSAIHDSTANGRRKPDIHRPDALRHPTPAHIFAPKSPNPKNSDTEGWLRRARLDRWSAAPSETRRRMFTEAGKHSPPC